MAKDSDPREALAGRDVALRAAAARELAITGVWSDVSPLLAIAMGDKSPSLRLYAAAAATRIVFRSRPLRSKQEAEVMDAIRAFNPQQNPSVLLVLGALGTGKARSRLGRLLRDPHSDVRMAAAAAVRRAALSSKAVDDTALIDEVRGWLQDGKHPLDATLELLRLVGEAGWSDCEGVLRKGLGLGAAHSQVAQEALLRLSGRTAPSAWQGLWLDAGADVLCETEAPGKGWLLVSDLTAFDGSQLRSVEPSGLQVQVEGLGTARRLWAPRLQTAGIHEALQVGGTTYWRCTGKDLASYVMGHIAGLGGFAAGCEALAESLGEVEGAVAPRAVLLLRWKAGDARGASERLDAMLALKKPKPELHWWRANMALSQGDLDHARRQVVTFLERAPVKSVYRAEAEGLLASLTP